jgi:hypothetical protein
MITLPTPLPLTIQPFDHPVRNTLSSKYPPIDSVILLGLPPGKIHIHSVVTLASSHSIEYINALQRNAQPNEKYDVVSDYATACIKMLLDNPQPATWLHCDAIALGFCSNLLLQQHSLARLPESSGTRRQREKARMALVYERRVAWDMVRVALRKVVSMEEAARLPFSALYWVLRVRMAVLEASGTEDEKLASEAEVERLQRVLGWFGARWGVGPHLETRLKDVMKAYKS